MNPRVRYFDGQMITEHQERVLIALETFWRRHARAPSCTELATDLGFRSRGGVHYHLDNLEAKGLITRELTKDRTLKTSRMTLKPGKLDRKPGVFIFWDLQ